MLNINIISPTIIIILFLTDYNIIIILFLTDYNIIIIII